MQLNKKNISKKNGGTNGINETNETKRTNSSVSNSTISNNSMNNNLNQKQVNLYRSDMNLLLSRADSEDMSLLPESLLRKPSPEETQIKPSEKDPNLCRDLSRSWPINIYDILAGPCCGGLNQTALQMLNQKTK